MKIIFFHGGTTYFFLIFVSILYYTLSVFVARISLSVIYLSIFFYFIVDQIEWSVRNRRRVFPRKIELGVGYFLARVRGRVYLPPIKLSKFLTAHLPSTTALLIRNIKKTFSKTFHMYLYLKARLEYQEYQYNMFRKNHSS